MDAEIAAAFDTLAAMIAAQPGDFRREMKSGFAALRGDRAGQPSRTESFVQLNA